MNPSDLQTAQSSGMAPIFYSPSAVRPDVPGASPQQTNLPQTHDSGGLSGFLERNAQTIGGIGGGILGEMIDPFGGGIAGAAAGQGVGQGIKNATTGTTTNPFEEAAIGGVSELGGLGTGKLLSKGIRALKGVAPDVFKAAFNVPAKLTSRLNPTGTAQKMIDYGIGGSLKDMVDISGKAMDNLDNVYRQSIGTVPGTIDTKPVVQAAKNIISDISTTDLKDSDGKAIMDQLDGLVKNENGHMQLNPQDAVDRMRVLQDVGHQLLVKGENKLNPVPRLSQIGQSYLAAGDAIEHALDDASSTTAIKGIQTNANKAALNEISPKLGEDFMAAKTPQEIRTLMSPFHRLRTMAGMTIDNPQKTSLLATALGGAGGFGLGGPVGAVAGMVASPVIQGAENAIRAPLTTGAARGMSGIADFLTKAGSAGSKDIIGKLSSADAMSQIATQGAGSAAGGLFTGSGAPTSSTPQGESGPVASLVSDSINNTMSPLLATKNGTNSSANIPSLAEILQAGGMEGLNAYLAYQKQETPQLTQSQQDDWEKAQNAVNRVKQFAQTFDQVKASGAGVGTLEELGTKIPGIQNTKSESALKAYNDNVGDLASTLSQVLGGGRGSKALLEELKTEIPTVNDSPQAAAMKLHLIVQALGQNMQTTLNAPATNTPGQLANFNGQTVPGTINFNNPNATGMAQ